MVFLLGLVFFVANLVNSRGEKEFQSWLAEEPKRSNYFSLLAGDCSQHTSYLASVLENSRFSLVQIPGPFDLLSKSIKALSSSCPNPATGCPSLILYFYNLTPANVVSLQIQEVFQAFYHHKLCVSPEFGGIHVDCSRVGFVFSTCFGESLVKKKRLQKDYLSFLEQGEEEELSRGEMIREIQFDIRSQWGRTFSFANRVYVDIVSLENPRRASLDQDAQLLALIHELEKEEKSSVVHPTTTTTPAVNRQGKIDFSIFDDTNFLGQAWAKQAAIRALDAIDKGLKRTNGPVILFLLGGAGTGKTLLSKLIARAYHGGTHNVSELALESKFALFPMSDYKSELDVDAFTSPRAGLQGTGAMVEIFRKTLDPVIVFDEIEKAHPSLLNEMFLSFLDDNEGFVQNKKDLSERYATSRAIFILTSNCFADLINTLYKEGNEEAVSQRVAEEMLRTTNPKCAWFAKKEVARRMKSGHVFAGLQRFGFVVFVPPDLRIVESMVTFFLVQFRQSQGEIKFAWTLRAEALLKKLAREKFLQADKSGGLSEVHSFLTGYVLEVIRNAMQECSSFALGDALLYVNNRSLHARIVACHSLGQERAPAVLDSKITEQRENVRSSSTAVTSVSGTVDDLHLNVEHDVESDIDEAKSWDFSYLWSFAVLVLAVAFLVAIAWNYQFMYGLAFWIQTSLLMGQSVLPLLVPHPLTSVVLWWFWPYLGMTSVGILFGLNVLLNQFMPTSLVVWFIGTSCLKFIRGFFSTTAVPETRVNPLSNPQTFSPVLCYVSFATRPSERHKVYEEVLSAVETRLVSRNVFAPLSQIRDQVCQCGMMILVCTDDTIVLEAAQCLEVLHCLQSEIPLYLVLRKASIPTIDIVLSEQEWQTIGKETNTNEKAQHLLLDGIIKSMQGNALIWDVANPQLARIQLLFHVKALQKQVRIFPKTAKILEGYDFLNPHWMFNLSVAVACVALFVKLILV